MSIFLLPRLGAATVVALIVVGQMLGSLAFDHFGLLGVPQHAASPLRILGAGLSFSASHWSNSNSERPVRRP